MQDDDYLHRFLFERFSVRGGFVRLAASWRAVRERHRSALAVENQLGEALAAVALLSGTIKFRGSLSLQLQGDGPVTRLLAQATEARTVRGMLHVAGEVDEDQPLQALLGQGRLVLTAEAPSGERYQGIVAVESDDLGAAIESYFRQSEQLPTRFWLTADGESACGLFLQRLPGSPDDEPWNRVVTLAETVTDHELRTLDLRTLLHRLFHEEDLRLYEPEPVAFRCNCSRERIANALVALGRQEVDSIIDEIGAIEADCEFCNAHYAFDRVDAAALFADAPVASAPDATH
jgi:molecular chaperone Hsp33